MSKRSSSVVDCPVCGASFDPTEAGGWCTNPECGEWQYIGDEVPEPTPSGDDSGVTAPDLTRSAGDADDGPGDGDPGSETGDADPAGDGESPDEAEGADAAELTPAIRRISEPAPTDRAAATEDETEADAETATTGDGAVDEPATDASDASCPSCGTAVDPSDNFCAACGADLDALDEGPTLAACPTCDAAVDADDSFCPSCGEDLAAAREALDAAAATQEPPTTEDSADGPETLVLQCRGEEIAVADDDTVGREVRRVITESGGEEDQAVRVHREHLRFVREDGRFYVVDLGDNPTRLNGTRLSKGDREPVAPGDEIELSGVATLGVESP